VYLIALCAFNEIFLTHQKKNDEGRIRNLVIKELVNRIYNFIIYTIYQFLHCFQKPWHAGNRKRILGFYELYMKKLKKKKKKKKRIERKKERERERKDRSLQGDLDLFEMI
jgi:hypothetical protein